MPLRPYPITDADYHQYEICFLYHLTHVDNMPSILKHGLLSHNSAHARGLVMEDLSDPDVQDRRADRRRGDRPLHDYVHRVCVRTDSTQTRLGDLMSAAGRQEIPIRRDRRMYF